MLLSDLIHRDVVDEDGEHLGRVVEVHLVQDAPPAGAGDHRLRVDGLVVGRRSLMARLGLYRPEHGRPTLVAWVARAACGRHDYVPWDHIRSLPDAPGHEIVVHGPLTGIPTSTD